MKALIAVMKCLVPLFALMFWLPTCAADDRAALVVSYRDAPPDIVTYCSGNHSGPLRAAIEEAATRVGYRIKWVPLSQAESFRALKAGRVDIVPSLFVKTSERAAIGRFSEGMGGKKRTNSFLMNKNDRRNVSQLSDLATFTIGYRNQSYYFREFHESKTLKTIAYETDADMARAFVAGTIDAVIVNNKSTLERVFLQQGFNEFKYADYSNSFDAQLYLLYSRDAGKQALFDRFDQAIVQMKQEGFMTDIYRSFDAMPLK